MRNKSSGSALTAVFAASDRPTYYVRVRGPGVGPGPWPWPGIDFLWGSPHIPTPLQFDKPIILHIRNDVHGEDVTFGFLSGALATGTQSQIGVLQPGDCVSLQLQNISGVYATCAPGLESTVGCIIKE